MTKQYGIKWANEVKDNLGFALDLLKEPDKQWDRKTTHLQYATEILNLIKKELEEITKKEDNR